MASKLRTGGNDVKSGLATIAISRDRRRELAVRNGIDPDQHSGALPARVPVGLVEPASHLHGAQVGQFGDRRAEPHAIAAPEFGRGAAHRTAGAHIGHQRDRSRRGRTQRERTDDAFGVGEVELRLVALLAHDGELGCNRRAFGGRLSARGLSPGARRSRATARASRLRRFDTSSARPRSSRARAAAERACASSASTAWTRRCPSVSIF